MEARRLRHLTATARRFRRPLAATLAFIAVLCALSALRPDPPATVALVAAAADLPAGARLTADDLARISFPSDFAIPGAIAEPSTVIGHVLLTPMRAGEILTETRLWAPDASAESGTRAVPVRLADADVAALLAPGMRIDVVRSDSTGGADVVAEDVRLIAVPRESSGSLLLVATDRPTAIRLAAASTLGGLSAIMR